MRPILSFFWEILKIVIIALIVVVPIRYFLFHPFFISGQSMEPNFENGDYLIIDEISYRLREPQRGEVIVFKYPLDPSQRYIKRIIGLPGETVEVKNGKVAIYKNEEDLVSGKLNEEKFVLEESGYLPPSLETPGYTQITLGQDEYFVLGDNRYFSSDSRRWGVLPGKDIVGRVFLRAWPVTAFAKFEAPAY